MSSRKKKPASPRTGLCPHCGTAFVPGAVLHYEGRALCPQCHADLSAPVSEELEAAIEEHHGAVVKIDAARHKLNRMEERANAGFLSRIWSELYRNKADLAKSELRRQRARADELWGGIWEEALSLHARNPWFLATHHTLDELLEDQGLAVAFLRGDRDALAAALDDERIEGGNLGEYVVYEELVELASDKRSPLHQAQIVCNIDVPTGFDEQRGVPTCSQIDLVLLTRSNAFVIEVKATSSDMSVNEEFSTVRKVAPEQSAGRKNRPPSKALGQNKKQAKAFRKICPHYPEERVHEVVLFVGPHSFKGGKPTFMHNRFVGSLPNGRSDFKQALEKLTRDEDDVLSQESLYLLAELLQEKYGMH